MIRVFAYFLLFISLSIGSIKSACSQTTNLETQLKTVYLFHFAELAEWPNPSQSITICLRGDSAIRLSLPSLEGKMIHGNPVKVLLDDQVPIADCRIVFLSDKSQLNNDILEQARLGHVLLVSDSEDFAKQGGMVQFTLREQKLKLVINLGAVRTAGLHLSSKLLRMAEVLE